MGRKGPFPQILRYDVRAVREGWEENYGGLRKETDGSKYCLSLAQYVKIVLLSWYMAQQSIISHLYCTSTRLRINQTVCDWVSGDSC